MPDWLTLTAPIVGSFVAAWFGARTAFRQTLKQLALNNRVAWYEEAIRSLAIYEDVLKRLDQNYLHTAVVKNRSKELPAKFRPERDRWKELVDAEARVRRALQLHEVYTAGSIRTQCSVTLNTVADLAAGQWFDLGPVPEIPSSALVRRYRLPSVRMALEWELRRILQMDGWLRSQFPRLDRLLFLRDLERQRKALGVAATPDQATSKESGTGGPEPAA
jgi:hypothetical protein